MNVIRRFFGGKPTQERMNVSNVWFYKRFGNFDSIIEGFSNDKAYLLANSLSEIYNPIDIIADRVSSVVYKLVQKSDGKEVQKPLRLTLLEDKVNALQSMDTFIYDLMFTMLAQGGVDIYRNKGGKKQKDISYINSLWVLNPLKSYYNYKKLVPANPFDITDLSDVVESVSTIMINDFTIPSEDVLFTSDNGFSFDDFKYKSPLMASEKNINNLLAVYSARYKQYANNGAAGILSAKRPPDEEMAQFDANQREQMVKELQKTDGVTGSKNFIGLSGVPMEFINTLGTIKDLMPFDETLENQIKIAGVYNVDKELLPKKDGTTFSNKKDAEKFLWQNTIKPYCYMVANMLNELLYIDKNLTLMPIFDEVEVLQIDRETGLKADLVELELIGKLRELGLNSSELENRWK